MGDDSVKIHRGSLQEWESFANKSPQASFFHTPLWSHILTKAGLAHTPEFLIFEFAGDLKAAVPALSVPHWAGLLQSWCSMPLGTYGGIMTNRHCSDSEWKNVTAKVLQNLAPGIRQPSLCLDLPPALSIPSESLPDRAVVVDLSTHLLPLQEDFQSLWDSRFKSNNRWSTRKAEKTGFQITELQGKEDMELFQMLYDGASAHWEFPLPNALIRVLGNESLEHGEQIRFRIVRHADKVVAGGVFLHHNHYVSYFLSAFDRHWGPFCPMNLLLKGEIQYACLRGRQVFDFGASLGIESVLKFKSSFGAEPVPRTRVVIRNRLWRALMSWRKTGV